MLLSIVIPTFNSSKTLSESLDSISIQTFKDYEVLIIDGVSKDNTLEIAESYRSKIDQLTIISEPDKGIYDAMNKGIDLAKGDWLYFLGSDDSLFDKNVLKKVFVEENIKESQFIYGNVVWGENASIYDGEFDIIKLFNKNICHQCIFIQKSVIIRLGKFNLKYPALADWYMNCKVFFDQTIQKKYINILVSKYCLDGTSGKTIDPFDTERGSLYSKELPLQSLKTRLKFNITCLDKNSFTKKIKFIISVFLYHFILIISTLKYNKLISN